MNAKFTILMLITFIITSCGGKKNSGPTAFTTQTKENIEIPDSTVEPLFIFELKTLTEKFHIERELNQVKIKVTPLYKNTARREQIKHLVKLTTMSGRSEVPAEACEVIESRILEFNVTKAHEKMSYRDLELVIDGKKQSFSPEKNFEISKTSSSFKVALPESRGDYEVSLSSLTHHRPSSSTFTKEECDRIIYESNGNLWYRGKLAGHGMDLTLHSASESLWTSYIVEIFDDSI